MQIKIDFREKDLIAKINDLNKENSLIKVKTENLEIGDIIICNDKNEEIFIIERKTLQDLAASIRDGRYKEQGYRLSNCEVPNHNIIYLLEGNINTYKSSKYGRPISKETLFSTITSLIYSKGFSIYKSLDLIESAEFLLQMTNKLGRIKEPAYYKSATNDSALVPQDNYLDVCKRVKKNNITPDNIGGIMLCQIPGVSRVSADAIMKKFETLENLIASMKENPDILNNVNIESKDGKNRKINITCRQNIYNYLLNKITHINI